MTTRKTSNRPKEPAFKATEDTLADYSLLLVDDRPSVFEPLMEGFLFKAKRVEIATDAFEAFTITMNWTPDLAIVDVNLPVMSGFELLDEWKQCSRSIRVMMMSGSHISVGDGLRAGQLGACDYVESS
jgi:DNA-binding response OmpR family regulator